MQLQLAAGQPIAFQDQLAIRARGHAIECRLYAERPAKGFLPSVGILSRFHMPAQTRDLRIESGVREGDRVTQYYDPMLAKLIAHGETRGDAIEHLARALREVEVAGVETNLAFLIRVLEHPAFCAGQVSTGFVELHKHDLLTSFSPVVPATA
jgi:3-methylcrotonyl-CoA carboxylase alpha subunit